MNLSCLQDRRWWLNQSGFTDTSKTVHWKVKGVDCIYLSINSRTDLVQFGSQMNVIIIRPLREFCIINEIFIGSDMDRYQFDKTATRALT